jgi:tetratricopeptide (TPR) repeat protein
MDRQRLALLFSAGVLVAGSAACAQPSPTTNVNITTQNASNTLIVSSHSSGNTAVPTPVAKSETKTKWTQSGNPIDTSGFDAEVTKAEKNLKSKSNDTDAKKALAEAFVKRGIALTDARQYASALGDYRKALKLDPENEEAKKWIDQIIGIYESINREYPKEGEEPPPLPFKKQT